MKCAIMQPTYFPWAGYFNLISQVDYFVFLDDVQFQKSSWQNRNQLLADGKPCWLTIPVVRNFLGQKLCDSLVDDQKPWRHKHIQFLQQNYGNHPHYAAISPLLDLIADTSTAQLTHLTIKIIQQLCEYLGLAPQFVLSSQMQVDGTRTQRLINICQQLNCRQYISPVGAKAYLEEDGFNALTDIELIINEFNPPAYPQAKTADFISHLSILDVIANIGKAQTADYILSPKTEMFYAGAKV